MSNTSDQTTQQSKTRLIIGEVGVDTETGIIGKGHSYDNGKTFTVDDTIYGRIYNADDHGRIWQGIQDKVAKVVEPAKSAANSAVAYANDAIKNSRVNSQAIDDINSAVTEAKQGANDAMSQAKSAWDVATGAKEAVTDFDPLITSAQSDASKALIQIADTASALSDAKTALSSDVAVAKNLANTAQTTADNAIKSASSVASDLTAVASQAKANASGITKVTSDVGLLQTTVADNSGNISKIQETAKQIQQAVSDNAGNITVAKQTADSAVAVASDASSNATVAIQTASQASITANNASGQAASAVLTANGAMTTASNAESDATVAIQTASGASLTATDAKDDATIAKQTASEATVQASNAESDFAQLSVRANKIETNVANNSGAIASVQQTANGLTTTVGKVDDRVKTIEDTTNWTTKTGALDMDTLTTTQNIYYRDSNLKNADGETGWAYIQVVSMGERVTQTVWHDRSSIQHTRTGALNSPNSNYNWDAWNEVATNAQVVQVKQTVDGIATTINDPKTGLNATYQTAQGNTTTISSVKSDVYQLETTANGLTSRVGNLESKTNTQETAIEQNKNAISLKADQTAVDKINGTVSQMQSTLTVQAGQIQEKVTSSQVTGMLSGYATQDYTQSLVTQKANDWNLNLTNLKTDVNAIKANGGGVNLVSGTNQEYVMGYGIPNTTWQDGYAYLKLPLNTTVGEILPQSPHTFFYTLTKGTSYTQTIWFETDAKLTNSSGIQFTWFTGAGHDLQPATLVNLGENKYKIYSTYMWPGKSNNSLRLFDIEQLGSTFDLTTGTYLKFGKLMLEEGTISHTWSPAPSDMATVTSVTNLSATVDGIQAQVYNSDGTSKITQLSNLIATKVSQGDYNSQITQFQNDINLRVAKGDVISQINQEAGGNTLIQVANGNGKLVLNANSVVFTGDAFIPDAYISTLNADKLMFYGSDGTSATMGASVAQYDDDKTKSTINLQYSGGIEIHSSDQQGSILTMHDNTIRLASKSWGDNPNAYQYSGFYAAPNYSLMNTYHRDGTTSGVAIDDNQIHIYGSSKDQQLGALQADVGWYIINGKTGSLTGDQISLKAGNTQAVLTDNNININNVSDTNDKNYDVAIHIKGWAEMTGWFTCMGLTQTSLLSTKTRIEPLDTAKALELINSADVATYQYKQEVAHGGTKRHASVIIDDVNDVARYQTPDEIISEDRQGRNDGDIVGYLMGAVQELTKKLKTLESKVG